MLDARRRRTPGRETEKPAPGVNSRMENSRSGKQENGEFRIGPGEIMLCISRSEGRDLLLKC